MPDDTIEWTDAERDELRAKLADPIPDRRVPLTYFTVTDLLAPMDGDDMPVVFEQPTRRSSLRGRALRRGNDHA